MQINEIEQILINLTPGKALNHMSRVGIDASRALGVRIPDLRKLAKQIGRSHDLAGRLWERGTRETMVLAGLVEDVKKINEKQMEDWVIDLV